MATVDNLRTAPSRVTVLTSDRDVLAKRFTVEGGRIVKVAGASLRSGRAVVVEVPDAASLARLADSLGHGQALAAGILTRDRMAARITTAGRAGGDVAARTLAHFAFPSAPGWLLLDYDDDGMPPEVAARIAALGGPVAAWWHVWPEGRAAAHVIRPSSSDGVRAGGEALASAGVHGFVRVEDVSRSAEALATLSERAWAAGLGWFKLSASGGLLRRSIFDALVGSPERLIFEAPPILGPGVTRDPRPTVAREGVTAAIPDAPPDLLSLASRVEASAREAIKPTAAKVEAEYVEDRAAAKAEREGVPLPVAREAVRRVLRAVGGVLQDDDTLQLRNGTWARVGDLLDNPPSSGRLALPDPIEGISYGADKATILFRARAGHPEDKPRLVSHAHGARRVYRFARYEAGGPGGGQGAKVPPFHPAPTTSRADALQAPARMARDVTRDLAQLRAVKAFRRELAALPEGMDPRERAKAREAIRADVAAAHGVETVSLAPVDPIRRMWKLPASAGKTGGAVGHAGAGGQPSQGFLHHALGLLSVAAFPTLDKAREAQADYLAARDPDLPSPPAMLWAGRSAPDPDATDPKARMCKLHVTARRVAEVGLPVIPSLCRPPSRPACRFAEACGAERQRAAFRRMADDPDGGVIFTTYAALESPWPDNTAPDLVVADEAPSPPDPFNMPLAELADPLGVADVRASARGGAQVQAERTADALEALTRIIVPIIGAIRRVAQDGTPGAFDLSALAALGYGGAQLEEARGELASFLDGDARGAVQGVQDAAAWDATADPAKMDAALSDMLAGVVGGKVRDVRRLLDCLARDARNGMDAAVAVTVEDLTDGRAVRVRPAPSFAGLPEAAALIHLDATGERELAEAFFGPLDLTEVRADSNVHVTYVTGRTFSKQALTGRDARGRELWGAKAEDSRRLRGWMAEMFQRHAGWLVGAPARVEASFKAELEAAGCPSVHFGAVRGINRFKDAPGVLILSREQPSPADIEDQARALASALGRSITTLRNGDGTWRDWPREARGQRMRDGTARALRVAAHPDPLADLVLRNVRDCEVVQAIERTRAFRREGEAVPVVICGDVLPDLTVDAVVPWAEVKVGGAPWKRASATGVLPLSDREAVRLHPSIWTSDRTARRDLSGVVAEVERLTGLARQSVKGISLLRIAALSGAVLTTYRPEPKPGGRVRYWHRALVWAETAEDARAQLESVAGPLRDFALVPEWSDALDAAHDDAVRAERNTTAFPDTLAPDPALEAPTPRPGTPAIVTTLPRQLPANVCAWPRLATPEAARAGRGPP